MVLRGLLHLLPPVHRLDRREVAAERSTCVSEAKPFPETRTDFSSRLSVQNYVTGLLRKKKKKMKNQLFVVVVKYIVIPNRIRKKEGKDG